MGAPHTLSVPAVGSAASRNRGNVRQERSATPTCARRDVARGCHAPRQNAGSCTGRWPQHRASDPTVASASRCPDRVARGRKHASPAAGGRRGHSGVMTPRRLRDTPKRTVRADKACGAPIFSSAISVDRGLRPRGHPVRATASLRPWCGDGELLTVAAMASRQLRSMTAICKRRGQRELPPRQK